jgi:hypothetical protein
MAEQANPKREVPKINLKSVSHFSRRKTWPLKHHIHHAYHHKLTIKTPRINTHFPQNPSKNTQTHTAKNTATNSSFKSDQAAEKSRIQTNRCPANLKV